ncbi:nitrate reductase molybdenum cofactor assembly chaperone [Paenibacillus pinistramenti]|uniref:nitrate reductase molybdenum cofactor assembly chaperone n=1 Tax=Paenibacillus pinistramenti TaxID=1768003 RepID=UPI001108E27D|nr:nitrate reductase molybdenum cofactor assembly chaperone [Paenibacillus pinistramenti]
MNDDQRFILAAVSRVLSYPGDSFPEELGELIEAAEEETDGSEGSQRLLGAMMELQKRSLQELREIYVNTFDWTEATGLYLTAHELGDSRDRGPALILLQHIISDAGFGLADGELADYLPALYELVAAAPENVHLKALRRRLAVTTKRIARHLPDENLYAPFFGLLVSEVFGEPSAEDVEKLEQAREKADLDDMPYPILYGMDGMAASDRPLMDMKMCK